MTRHIIRLQEEGYVVESACSITGKYFQELRQKGFILHEVPFARNPYSYKNLGAYRKLCSLVASRGYDVIFCHEPVGGLMGRLVGKKYGIKVVYMAHGFHFYKGAPLINNILYYNVEKLLSKWTYTLVTINKEDFDASQKFYARHKCFINGIGVDIKKFSPNESSLFNSEFNLSEKSIKLLSVGELIPRKNHIAVIEAIGSLQDVDIHYFIAGEGMLYRKLRERVIGLGLERRIHFLGFRRDIGQLCNSCDIFVLPSLQEGLSLALMEAMACGKPIIASNIRGNVDLIKDGVGGILVSPKDSSRYADAIRYLSENQGLGRSMGLFNKDAIKQYDINIIENRIIEIIKK